MVSVLAGNELISWLALDRAPKTSRPPPVVSTHDQPAPANANRQAVDEARRNDEQSGSSGGREHTSSTEADVSEQTHAAIEEAIREHFADEFEDERGMATSWVIQVSGVLGIDAGSSAHLRETPRDQPAHVTLGLIEYLRLGYRRSLLADDDDDDTE